MFPDLLDENWGVRHQAVGSAEARLRSHNFDHPHGKNRSVNRRLHALEVDQGRPAFHREPQCVVRRLFGATPRQVVPPSAFRVIALRSGCLVLIPALPSELGNNGLDAERTAHLPRFEDPLGAIGEMNGLSSSRKPGMDPLPGNAASAVPRQLFDGEKRPGADVLIRVLHYVTGRSDEIAARNPGPLERPAVVESTETRFHRVLFGNRSGNPKMTLWSRGIFVGRNRQDHQDTAHLRVQKSARPRRSGDNRVGTVLAVSGRAAGDDSDRIGFPVGIHQQLHVLASFRSPASRELREELVWDIAPTKRKPRHIPRRLRLGIAEPGEEQQGALVAMAAQPFVQLH